MKYISLLLFLCLTGCAAWPLDLAITTSKKPQWGMSACVGTEEFGFKAGQSQITGRVWGFVKGMDRWGTPTNVVWPPEPGVA